MTMTEMEADLYQRLGFDAATVDTVTITRLAAFLNETQSQILAEPGMESLTFDSTTFPSVASTTTYTLAASVARPRQIRETTNDILLTPRSLGWYRANYPDPTQTTGTPDSWVLLGYGASSLQWDIALVPTPASAITYSVDYERNVTALVTGTGNVPIIPARFHWLIGVGARMKEYEKQQDRERYASAHMEFLGGLRKLKHFVFSQTAGSLNLRGSSQAGHFSSLGSWFPAGS